MTVAQLLKTKGTRVVTTRPETPIRILLRRMILERIGAVVVTTASDNRIVGIISERDIVRGLGEHGTGVLSMCVTDLMTTSVRTCSPHDKLKGVMSIMTRHKIRHLPVVDGIGLCGIVSIGDVVNSRLRDMELETNVLRDACMASGSSLAS